MNKNLVIGIFIIILVLVAGAFFIFKGDKAFDVSFLDKDAAELDSMAADIDAFSMDNAAIEELNQTFSDILDESAGISAAEALGESSIDKEAALADLSQILNVFGLDDAALSELNQVLGEVLQ